MTELKYGLLAAFVIFLLMTFEYNVIVPILNEAGFYIGIFATILPMSVIYPAIKERREKVNYGFIPFKEAFRAGTVITFIVTVIIVIATYLYFEVASRGTTARITSEVEKNLIVSETPRSEIENRLTFFNNVYSLQSQIIIRLALILTAGMAITGTSSAILKKSRRKKPLL